MNLYKILLLKRYFDVGLGLTQYFKYIVAFAGIFRIIDGFQALILVTLYLVFCFVLGFIWLKYGFYEIENEISNRFNPFQTEVRAKLKLSSKSKKFK